MPFSYDNVPSAITGRSAVYQFVHQNIATSAASTAMKISDVTGVTQFAMPYDGVILATSGCANANITASTIRMIPSINGATITAAVATNTATTVKTLLKTVIAPNPYDTSTVVFSAGDRLGCKLSTTASYAPATLDWTAGILVEFKFPA